MNKELYEALNKMKSGLLHGQSVTLNKRELHLIIKYINEIEKELAGEIDE